MRWSAAVLVSLLAAVAAAGEEWPQWGGPNRDFTVAARDLATSWPTAGPPREWSLALGPGHASPVVADGTLYALYRDGDNEVLVAHHAENGGLKWRREQPAELWDKFNEQFGVGPHVTPAVRDGRIYTVTVRGLVQSLEARTGKELWSHDLWQAHKAEPTDRGYASSPLLHGELVILPAAGRGLVALDAGSGAVRWTSFDLANGAFSSPINLRVGDRDQVLAFVAEGLVAIDPADGRVLWRHPHKTKYNINAITPLVSEDGLVFVSSAYDTGSRAVQLAAGGQSVEQLWFDRAMQVHHASVIRLGDIIVGSSGDFGPAFLMGVDVRSGEVRFKARGFAKANLLRVGEQILILDEDGQLGLARLDAGDAAEGSSKVSLEVQASAQVLSSRSWAVPALVGTTLYLRDQQEIVALDLSAGPAGP